MNKKMIEKLVLGGVAVVLAGVMAVIPLSSYLSYQNYLKEIEASKPQVTPPAPKPVLDKITAEFAEGVEYFANDAAMVEADDFVVTAYYTLDGVAQDPVVLESSEYSFTAADNFYEVGGTITIRYRTATAQLTANLIPVTLEGLEMTRTPYTIKYRTGDNFSASGMVLTAVYNDGTTKVLEAGEYTVDKSSALVTSDNKATFTYTEGEVTKTYGMDIFVADDFSNGAVKELIVLDGATVIAGETVHQAQMEVNAVYESGNRAPLSISDINISGTDEAVEFGKMYNLTVTYKEDTSKKVTTPVTVRAHIEGEDGVIVGGKANTEPEYTVLPDGSMAKTGNDVTFAGNFANSVKTGKEGSLTISVNSATESVADITVRASNSLTKKVDAGYIMSPLQINTILDLTINDRPILVPASVILKGCGPAETYAPLYGVYYEFTFKDVELDPGMNDIKFNFKTSTKGESTSWGESPSTMNIDYINVDTLGSEIPESRVIKGIEVSKAFKVNYGMLKSDVVVPVVATLDNGTRIALAADEYTVDIIGGEEGTQFMGFGEYTFNVTLKADSSIRTTTTYEIEEYNFFQVLLADLVVEGDKVYYVFSGNMVGYKAEDVKFFDGATSFDFELTNTPTTFVMKIDVTDLATGTKVYPHISLNGENYDNGANANGDVRDNGLSYENGKSVTLNGKTYAINTEWSMPVLSVS